MSKFRKVSFKRQLSNYFFVLKIVWRHSKHLIVVYAFKAVIDGLGPVVQAFLVGSLLNELTLVPSGQADRNRAVLFLLLSAGMQLAFFLIRTVEGYLFSMSRELVEMKMQKVLLESRAVDDLVNVELPESVDKYERATMGPTETLWYIRYTTDIIAAVIGVVGVISFLAATIPLVLLVLLPLPLFSMHMSIRNFLTNRDYWETARPHRIRARFIENMFSKENGVLEIRMFDLTSKMIQMWQREYKKSVSVSRNKEYLAAKQDTLVKLIESGMGAAIDIWLVFQVFANALSLGLFEQSRRLVGSYVLSLGQFSSGFSSIILYGYHIDDYRNYIEQTNVYSQSRTGVEKLKSPPDTIEAVNLSFRYPTSDKLVLDDVNLTIKRGENVAIVGANGAGKTSLIKNLFGFYDPSSGAILYDGVSHDKLDFDSLYNYSSSLMQDFWSFDFLTLGQAVALSFDNNYDRQRVEAALKTVGLWEDLRKYENGLDTNFGYIEDDGIKLSGGQTQRLAIARVLYRQDPILVMDEPTSAIDAKSEQEVMDHIFDIYGDKTLIVISHRLSTVSRADKIIFMKNGRVVETGTHRQLFKPGTAYYELFHKQALRIK